MSKFCHPELIDLYIRLLGELDFIIRKYDNGTKYSIGSNNKGFLIFDDKQMFLPNYYYFYNQLTNNHIYSHDF